MKPVSLYLRGFRGIRDGLGRDELSLDLAALTEGAQLIAICGANGRGKTTVLDNLTPYPTMPSRAGGDGSGAFSYYDHVFLPESLKDLVWEHGGRRYRSQLVIRNESRRRTEAYLHVLENARWCPVRTDDGTVADGKMETYMRCLDAVLGAERTFFVSAFAAQGRRQLCAYRTGEVKALLADLLGLEDIRCKGQQAAEVVKLLRVGLGAARDELSAAALDMDAAKLDGARLPAIVRDIAAAQARRSSTLRSIDVLHKTLARLEAERAQLADRAANRAALQTELAGLTASMARQASEHAADRQREAGRLARLQREAQSRCADQRRARAAIDAQRGLACAVMGEAGGIRRASRRLGMARAVVAAREQRALRCREVAAELRTVEERERSLAKEIESVERMAGQAALQLEDVQRRHGLTLTVPCKGMPMQQDCRLLGDAHAARPLIPDASAELARLNDTRSGLRSQLAQLRVRAARLRMAPRQLADAEAKLARSRRRAEGATALAARSRELAQAEATIQDCDERLGRLEQSARTSERQQLAETTAVEAAIAQVDARAARHQAEQGAACASLRQRLAHLPPEFDEARIAAAAEALRVAQVQSQADEAALGPLFRQRAAAEEALEAADKLRERCAALQTRCSAIETELSTWTMFAKCMGNDGLIALMIDDAGPELSSLANDLLLACYGPRFTLSIRTQVETAKGEAREGFDIVVHDAEAGQCKPMHQMSGGERVWINDCLTRAIALYLGQCSGRHYETLFTDESDGPLDTERKRMFMRMKRQVLRVGGYEREYFISQTLEMIAMADAVIDLDVMCADLPG
ncbi:DNA repair protein [Duganella vulcania]|uniref:DNA repair protein n=1 Tax=Duganella vulcania TaxID=2692166 RepID=A0A845GS25_9BURK|nr:DNA repair protein [Duganella vulcania]MYM96455.1 DNA repair protein [Duganella vulcania]